MRLAVEFDHGERRIGRRIARDFEDAAQQGQRQRALAGADFDQAIAGCGIDGAHDPVHDAGLVQEVLPELLLGLVAVRVHVQASSRGASRARRAANPMAHLAARIMLEGSASPRPASSSAVPWSTATRT